MSRGAGHPLEDRTFALFVVAVTLVLLWTVWAFSGAILWAVVLAVVFTPLNDHLLRRWRGRTNRAAAVTVLIIFAGILVPLLMLGSALVGEIAGLLHRLQSGQIDVGSLFDRTMGALPEWGQAMLRRSGLADIDAVVRRVSATLQHQFNAIAGHAFAIGSDVLGTLLSLILTLYLAFFLIRDGRTLATRAGEAIPLQAERRHALSERFVSVVRATVKGTVVVALAQGALGGLIMAVLGVPEALLWAVVMAFGALIPAVGTGLVWVPVSLYLLAVGQTWQGIVMAALGAFVIGNIDNVLRPVLVGRETKLPDALVLLTTLGGLSAFGFNGLIIGPIAAALFLAAWGMVRQDLGARRGAPIHEC